MRDIERKPFFPDKRLHHVGGVCEALTAPQETAQPAAAPSPWKSALAYGELPSEFKQSGDADHLVVFRFYRLLLPCTKLAFL